MTGSGIGRAIACQYAQRGARVCIVGRRQDALDAVKSECQALHSSVNGDSVLAVRADFADARDMIQVRDALAKGV